VTEDGDFRAERRRELHAHVAQATQAHHRNARSLGHAEVAERRVGRDASARSGAAGWIETRHPQDEVLVTTICAA
jgi:hypothetical protein